MKEKIESSVVGTLERISPYLDFWASSPFPIPFFEQAVAPVWFRCDPKADHTFIHEADEALGKFLKLGTQERESLSDQVFKLCDDFIGLVGLNDAIETYKAVKDPQPWIKEILQRQEPLLHMTSPRDVWRFVQPKTVHLTRSAKSGRDMFVQLECHCNWDDEHGVQFIFQDGNVLTRISENDGSLTYSA